MAFAQWPEDINPLPLRDGYSFEPHEDILRAQIGLGLNEQRRPFGESDAFPTLTIPMTGEQLASFMAFWTVTLWRGAAWFEMPLRMGPELTTSVVRIPEEPEAVFDIPDWLVTFKLEVRDAPFVMEGGAYMAAVIGDDAFEDFVTAIGDFVDVEWPAYFEEVV